MFISHLHKLCFESGSDELGVGALFFDHQSDCRAVLGVQCSIDLVKEVEGCWIAALDGKYQCQCHQGLLTPTEALHLHGPSPNSKAHRDPHSGKHVHCVLGQGVALLLLHQIRGPHHLQLRHRLVPLDLHQLLENVGELVFDLPKGPENRFVLLVVQVLDQVVDFCSFPGQLVLLVLQRIPGLHQLRVLLQGLLIDMHVPLQRFIGLVQLVDQLLCFPGLIRGCVRGHSAEVPNLLYGLVTLHHLQALVAQKCVGPLLQVL
mmetsp:Transcript_110587/g.191688  ORF Transcript_110587/g.191688 Transcript_110587/m.191688 type:complete len:261 (-) Transcript_110587:2772-3554(-)